MRLIVLPVFMVFCVTLATEKGGAAVCETLFCQGGVLEWTRLEAGVAVDSGELRIQRVLGNRIDAVQSPYTSAEAWPVRGELDDDTVTFTVPRWRETWKGECGEQEVTGTVQGDQFVMRPVTAGYSVASRAGISRGASASAAPSDNGSAAANGNQAARLQKQAEPAETGAITRFNQDSAKTDRFAKAGKEKPPIDGSLAWAPASGGEIPANALQAGQEPARPLFICRAKEQGLFGTGKIGRAYRGCAMGQRGREAIAGSYEVLTGSSFAVGWIVTDAAELASVQGKLAPWGQAAGPFVCRGEYKGGVHPGQIHLGDSGCAIGYGGQVIVLDEFEVMTRR